MNDPASGKETEGRYANYCEIGNNEVEFLLQFGQWYGGDAQPNVHTRIVTSPTYAKEILAILQRSIDGFERMYGTITSRS
jgi:hypothetical protein